jgi:hypothetical protein
VNYKTKEMNEEELKRTGKGRIGLWMRHAGIFERQKILIRQVGSSITASIENNNLYYDQTVHGVHIADKNYDSLFLLAILNSRLFKYYYKTKNSAGGKIFPHIHIVFLEQLPIRITSTEAQTPFIAHAQTMLVLTKELNEKRTAFIDYFCGKFALQKITRNLESWHTFEFSDFIKELGKQKVKFSSTDEFDFKPLFDREKKACVELQSQITKTDAEIDKMVYALYGLSKEEIRVVEGSKEVIK